MSEYGEGIIRRLPSTCELQKTDNPGRRVLDITVGEWLDNHDIDELFEGIFLTSATGKYLDLHGRELNCFRQLDESDNDYRLRLLYTSLGHLTLDYLVDVFKLKVYVNISDYDPTSNKLTSDNQYIHSADGIMIETTTAIKNILKNKFIFGSEIVWLTP